MKANVDCRLACLALTVFLNGKKLDDCFEADEEQRYVWVQYRNAEGRLVSRFDAEPGALIWQDSQVIKLKGKVEIKIDPPIGMTEDEVRRECEKHFVPIQVTRLEDTSKVVGE